MAVHMLAQWKIPLFNANAQQVYNEVHSITDSSKDDKCEPQELVDFARNNPLSESYKCFNWNDTVAAESWRRKQARDVINNLITVEIKKESSNDESKKAEIKLFYNIEENKGYKPVEVIVQSQSDYQALKQKAFDELQDFKKRYSSIKELAKIFALIP